jgi:hypothetical protein
LFITKQIGLQLSNPKIETGRTLFTDNNRLYNGGLNTLAQIPVNAFGTHFDRSGLGPIIQDQNKYEAVVSLKNIDTPNENRLVKLFNDKIVIGSSETIINDRLEKLVTNLNKSIPKSGILGKAQRAIIRNIENVKRDLNPQYYLIDEYKGGPDSLYGIGNTTIKRYYFSDNPRTENYDVIDPRPLDNRTITGGPNEIISK